MRNSGYKTRFQQEQERQRKEKQNSQTLKKCSNCAFVNSCKVSQSIVRMSKHYKDINDIDPPISLTDLLNDMASNCKKYVYNNIRIS